MKSLLLLAFFFTCFVVFPQETAHQPSKKNRKLFDRALASYRLGDYDQSRQYVEKVLSTDSSWAEAWILLGDLRYEEKDLEGAAGAYQVALSLDPISPEIVRNLLANCLFEDERYGEAIPHLEALVGTPGLRPDLIKRLKEDLIMARFRQKLMDHPVPFRPENLGEAVNSKDEEYINSIQADEDRIIFTRRSPASNDPMKREFKEDFFWSVLQDTGWKKASRYELPGESEGDAGGLCLSADGRMLFFTSCFRPDGKGSCDIYYCEKQGDKWSAPKNMGEEVNSDNWDAQPSVSPDGNTLYFASNREGSLGSSDIWMTRRLPEGGWSKPVNLGPPVNTMDVEMAPYIHFDNKTLYFSSAGHEGMGQQDLFYSRYNDTAWSVPKNIGYPLNTRDDELILIVSPDGENAFISATLDEGYGGYDIYSFSLPGEVRADPVTYFKGRVYDRESREPLQATFQLIDLQRDSLMMKSRSSQENGSFLVCVPLGLDYALNVSAPGYLFYSDHLALDIAYDKADPYLKDIPLEPVKAGNTIILKNIFYETDQYRLKAESRSELNKLVSFLEDNPGIFVEISGHTDNIGTEEYNLVLSGKRAGAVREYLVNEGIDPVRVRAAGYAFSRPVASNEVPEGRAENRRTELKVLKIE